MERLSKGGNLDDEEKGVKRDEGKKNRAVREVYSLRLSQLLTQSQRDSFR